jgi:hypothetical protein
MSSHYREECEFGVTHGQCRCPNPAKHVRKIKCDRPAEHRSDEKVPILGSTWLFRSTDGRDQEALLSVPAGYTAPELMVIQLVPIAGSGNTEFQRVREVEE